LEKLICDFLQKKYKTIKRTNKQKEDAMTNNKRFAKLLKAGFIPRSAVQDLIDVYDPIVCVIDYNPKYPDWIRTRMHPELGIIKKFDVTKLQCWLHPDQVDGYIKGNVIYEEMKKHDLLKKSLGLAEFIAIQKRGIGFFRQNFYRKTPFGWRDVVLTHDGNLRVPVLYEDGIGVRLDWCLFCNDLDSSSPALRFAN